MLRILYKTQAGGYCSRIVDMMFIDEEDPNVVSIYTTGLFSTSIDILFEDEDKAIDFLKLLNSVDKIDLTELQEDINSPFGEIIVTCSEDEDFDDTDIDMEDEKYSAKNIDKITLFLNTMLEPEQAYELFEELNDKIKNDNDNDNDEYFKID